MQDNDQDQLSGLVQGENQGQVEERNGDLWLRWAKLTNKRRYYSRQAIAQVTYICPDISLEIWL